VRLASPTVEDFPRIRYAKSEIVKLITALEVTQDPNRLSAEMRVIELEEMLEEARALAARWRESYQVVIDLLVAASGPEPDIKRIDEILRVWVLQ